MDLKAYQQQVQQEREQRVLAMIAEGKEDNYVHGHGHDYHSIRDAISRPKDLMKKVQDLGMTAVAVTNHGNINGWVEEAEAAKEFNIKLIPGVEVYEVDDRTIHSRDMMATLGHKRCHMVLWAITQEGYEHLIQICSDAGTIGKFDGRQRTDLEYIRRNGLGKGIRMSSACLGGRMAQLAMAGEVDRAVDFMKYCRTIFDEAYCELQDSGIPDQQMLNRLILDEIAPRSACPLILNRDYHYIEKAHGDIHDTFKAMAYGNQKNDSCRGTGKYASLDAYYVSGPQEMWDFVNAEGIPSSAIYNGLEIAEACTAKVTLGQNFFPKYPKLPKGYSERTYLRQQAYEGFMEFVDWAGKKNKMIDVNEYVDRLNYELSVISSKGYDGYFLIIWDVIKWCWDNGIITGPGRGSAAGSLLSFCLRITRLDPIDRGLIFERFLNPFRESWPDIDFDIPSRHRPRVMQYVLDTYGEDHVSQIISYGTLGIRSGVRDIIKALMDDNDAACIYSEEVQKNIAVTIPLKMPDQGDINFKRIKQIAEHPDKFVDEWGEHKARKVINQCQEFMRYMTLYPELELHLKQLEGMIMQTGLHAGGVIICPVPIATVLPIEYSKGNTAVLPVSCWDMDYAEKAGFMKMDFLGLGTLDVVDISFEFIERTTGTRPDMYEIGRDDPAVFKMICDGYTHGVFQISGDGLTNYLRQANPRDMDAWCDVIALYRPGPLDAKIDKNTTIAEKYVQNGDLELLDDWEKQLHPVLRKLFRRSRGVMTYQEDVMNVCQDVAGYSLGDADTFRRIIGKKKVAEVKALRYQFLYGGVKGLEMAEQEMKAYADVLNLEGIALEPPKGQDPSEKQARYDELKTSYTTLKKNKNNAAGGLAKGFDLDFLDVLFAQMAAFAGYAFNRSHSDVYADLGYVTAWTKCHYPAHFMAALLTMETDPKEMEFHYTEVKRLGIPLLQPDINKSQGGFTIEMSAEGTWGIRMGMTGIKGLGNKVCDHIIDRRTNAGMASQVSIPVDVAEDLFAEIDDIIWNHPQPFLDFDDFIARIDRRTVTRAFLIPLIKVGAFDSFEPNRFVLMNHFSNKYIAAKADKLDVMPELIYEAKDGLAWEKEFLGLYVSSHPLGKLPYQPLTTILDRETVDIGGQITNIKKVKTKNGDTMAFVTVQTQSEKMDVTFFPREWDAYADRVWKDGVMIFRVKKEIKEKTNYIIDKVLIPKKDQVSDMPVAERPVDVPKKGKAAKKEAATLADFGGVDQKEDPILELFG